MTLRSALAALLVLASPAARADGGPWAMPSLARVSEASAGDAPVALAVAAGYGYTEDVLAQNDVHHRAFASVAAAWRPLAGLAFAARLDGRYDRHRADTFENDVSGTVEPRLAVRLTRPVGAELELGAELGVWFPGESGPEADAISPRLLGLLSWRRGGFALHLNGGFHLDRSGHSVDDPATLFPPDRVALDVSDSPAALAGFGVEARAGAGTLWGEATWDVLVGDHAPDLSQSPLHAVAGYRHPLGEAVDLLAYVDVNLAKREVDMTAPLVPIGPRVAATLAVAYRFEETRRSGGAVVADAAGGGPASEPAPAPPPRSALVGRIMGPDGPIAGATVRVGDKQTTTDQSGAFVLEDVPPGAATIVVEKKGLRRIEKKVSIGAGERLSVDLTGEAALPDGQIRGTVMTFDGSPLQAKVRIDPGGLLVTADEQGTFQVDVPPGDYEVTVEMPGFLGSRRKVKVEQRGVTLLPIDLKRK